jgi:Arylsulfotransferase (ASST)
MDVAKKTSITWSFLPSRLVIKSSIALVSLGFLAGAFWAKERVWPYSLLDAFHKAVKFYVFETDFYSRPNLAAPIAYGGSGVTVNLEGEAFDGLTLMSGMFPTGVSLRLIGMDGGLINEWPVDFWKIWPNPNHVYPDNEIPEFEWGYHVQGMWAAPDGAVVFNVAELGMVKMDRCGDVLWTLDRRTHHVVTPVGDGTFWVPGKRDARAVSPKVALPGMLGAGDGFSSSYEDLLVHVSADGKVLRELSFLEALIDDGAWSLLYGRSKGDPTHINDIELVTPALARSIPGAAAGDLLVSARNLNALVVVSQDGAVRWRQMGPWLRQHDPDILPDGTISVFNNNHDSLGGSNIVEFDARTEESSTRFPEDATERFYTDLMGTHQALDNGNLLITESMRGRVFEVDEQGKIVWEYVQPFNHERAAIIEDAIRFRYDYFNVTDWSCPS